MSARAQVARSLFGDTDFGLTHAQADAVKEVLAAVARKKVAKMRSEMAAIAAAGAEARPLECRDGNTGTIKLRIHPTSYHYWGQRLGYECWHDPQFVREYLRDNPEARVRTVAPNPTVALPQLPAATERNLKFRKSYGP